MIVEGKAVTPITKEVIDWFKIAVVKIPYANINIDVNNIDEITTSDLDALTIANVKIILNTLREVSYTEKMDFEQYKYSRKVFETIFNENENVEGQMNQLINDFQNGLIKEYDPKTWHKIK